MEQYLHVGSWSSSWPVVHIVHDSSAWSVECRIRKQKLIILNYTLLRLKQGMPWCLSRIECALSNFIDNPFCGLLTRCRFDMLWQHMFCISRLPSPNMVIRLYGSYTRFGDQGLTEATDAKDLWRYLKNLENEEQLFEWPTTVVERFCWCADP